MGAPSGPLAVPALAVQVAGRRRGSGRRRAPARSTRGAAAPAAPTSGRRPASARAAPRPRRRRPRPGRPSVADADGDRLGPVEAAQPGSHSSGKGVSSAQRSGTREAASTGRIFSSASGPWVARTSRTAAPSRRRRGSSPPTASSSWSDGRRAEAERPQPQRRGRARQRLQPRRQDSCAGPAAEALGRPSPCSTLQLPPPARIAPRRSPSRVRPRRCGAASRRSTSSSRARSSCSPAGPFRQLDLLDQLLVRGARAQRRLLAAGEPQRRQPERAEAVGDLVGGEPRQLAQGVEPEPLEREDQRLARGPGASRRWGRTATRSGARKPRSPAGWTTLPSRRRAAAKAAVRVGATPMRASPSAAEGGPQRFAAPPPAPRRARRRGSPAARRSRRRPRPAARSRPPPRSPPAPAPSPRSAPPASTGSVKSARPGRDPPERPGRAGVARRPSITQAISIRTYVRISEPPIQAQFCTNFWLYGANLRLTTSPVRGLWVSCSGRPWPRRRCRGKASARTRPGRGAAAPARPSGRR